MEKQKNTGIPKGLLLIAFVGLVASGYCLYAYDAQPNSVQVEKNISL